MHTIRRYIWLYRVRIWIKGVHRTIIKRGRIKSRLPTWQKGGDNILRPSVKMLHFTELAGHYYYHLILSAKSIFVTLNAFLRRHVYFSHNVKKIKKLIFVHTTDLNSVSFELVYYIQWWRRLVHAGDGDGISLESFDMISVIDKNHFNIIVIRKLIIKKIPNKIRLSEIMNIYFFYLVADTEHNNRT